MEDGDEDKGLPNPQPGREEREKYSLGEKGDDTIDGHDYSDRLNCKAQTAWNVEGRLMVTVGGDSVVLQENGKKVIVGHTVVGKDAERNDYHGDFSIEDFGHLFRRDGCRRGRSIDI